MPAKRLMGLRDCVGVVTKIFSLGSPTRLNWAGLSWLSFDSAMAGAFAQHSEEL
jgi:hypothetical protein